MVFAGAPEYGGPDTWPEERELAWARDVLAFAGEVLGPNSLIVSATLHRDETSPHVHVLAVPVGEAEAVIGWDRVNRRSRTSGVPTGG